MDLGKDFMGEAPKKRTVELAEKKKCRGVGIIKERKSCWDGLAA